MAKPLLTAIGRYLPDSTRTRDIVGTIAAFAALALAVGVVVGVGASAGASKRSTAGGSAATVQQRDLVATDTESGTLGYANPNTVFNRVSGTITSLPAVGAVIKPGGTLYRVDGSPVILFNGALPAYRDLSGGVSDGPDVQELKANLANLGFNPGTVNQTFDASTTSAVDAWQASLGQTQTGTVTLGAVVFLPGPQRVTSVNTVLGSNGAASGSSGSSASAGTTASGGTSGSGSSSGSGTTTGASTTVAPTAQFVSLTTSPSSSPASSSPADSPTAHSAAADSSASCPKTTSSQPKTQTQAQKPASSCNSSASSAQTLAALLALLKAETKELKQSRSSAATSGGSSRSAAAGGSVASTSASRSGGSASAGGASSGASGGGSSTGASGSSSGSGSAQPILQTTSTQLVVTVSLDATKQTEAVVGEPVTVELPNGSAADGKITRVSPVAQASSSSSSSGGGSGGASSGTPTATVPVTITLTSRGVKALDQAAVSVNFEQQVQRGVLSVPVTALVATAGGGYAVQEAESPHRLIPVTPGLFAAGYVQISGAGIFSGLQVTNSQG